MMRGRKIKKLYRAAALFAALFMACLLPANSVLAAKGKYQGLDDYLNSDDGGVNLFLQEVVSEEQSAYQASLIRDRLGKILDDIKPTTELLGIGVWYQYEGTEETSFPITLLSPAFTGKQCVIPKSFNKATYLVLQNKYRQICKYVERHEDEAAGLRAVYSGFAWVGNTDKPAGGEAGNGTFKANIAGTTILDRFRSEVEAKLYNHSVGYEAAAEDQDSAGFIERMIAEPIGNGAFNLYLWMCNWNIDITIDSLVFGRLSPKYHGQVDFTHFGMEPNNPYGIVAASAYYVLRRIVLGVLPILFMCMLLRQLFRNSQKGRAMIKEAAGNFLLAVVLMFAAPYLVEICITVRDGVLKYTSLGMDSILSGAGIKDGLGSNFIGLIYTTYANNHTLLNALIWLAAVLSGFFYLTFYIQNAVLMAGSVAVLPIVLFISIYNPRILKDWWNVFFPILCVPLIDMILLQIPTVFLLVFKRVLGGRGGSIALGIVLLIIMWNCSMIRDRIVKLLGFEGLRRGGGGILAAAAIAARMMIPRGGKRDGGKESGDGTSREPSLSPSASGAFAEREGGLYGEALHGVGELGDGAQSGGGWDPDLGNSTEEYLTGLGEKDGPVDTSLDGGPGNFEKTGGMPDGDGFFVGETQEGELPGESGVNGLEDAACGGEMEGGEPAPGEYGDVPYGVLGEDAGLQGAGDVAAADPMPMNDLGEVSCEGGLSGQVDLSKDRLPAVENGAYAASGSNPGEGLVSKLDGVPGGDVPMAPELSVGRHGAGALPGDGFGVPQAGRGAGSVPGTDGASRAAGGGAAASSRPVSEAEAAGRSGFRQSLGSEADRRRYDNLVHLDDYHDRISGNESVMAKAGYSRATYGKERTAYSQKAERLTEHMRASKERMDAIPDKNSAEWHKEKANYDQMSNAREAVTGRVRQLDNAARLDRENGVLRAKAESAARTEQQYARAQRYGGMNDRTYQSARDFELQKKRDNIQKSVADYKNFDSKRFEGILSPSEKESFYRERAEREQRAKILQNAARVAKTAGKAAGTAAAVAVGTAAVFGAGYGGASASMAAGMFGAVGSAGVMNKVGSFGSGAARAASRPVSSAGSKIARAAENSIVETTNVKGFSPAGDGARSGNGNKSGHFGGGSVRASDLGKSAARGERHMQAEHPAVSARRGGSGNSSPETLGGNAERGQSGGRKPGAGVGRGSSSPVTMGNKAENAARNGGPHGKGPKESV